MKQELLLDFTPFHENKAINDAFDFVINDGVKDVSMTITAEVGFTVTHRTGTVDEPVLKVLNTAEIIDLVLPEKSVRARTDIMFRGYRSCEIDIKVHLKNNVIITETTLFGKKGGVNLRISVPLDERHNGMVKGMVSLTYSENWVVTPPAVNLGTRAVLQYLRRVEVYSYRAGCKFGIAAIRYRHRAYKHFNARKDILERLRALTGSELRVTVDAVNYSKYLNAHAAAVARKGQ